MKFAQAYYITLKIPEQLCWLKNGEYKHLCKSQFSSQTEISSSFCLMFNSLNLKLRKSARAALLGVLLG